MAACTGLPGCTEKPKAASRRETYWRAVNTWTGRARLQTESWPSDSGAMRIRWSTSHAGPDSSFQLTIHSAISGRPMQTVVDHSGDGEGTAFFSDDPRVFFAVVDARNLDWTFTIEEPVDVIVTPK
ncbi:MAG: hypothetical protein JSU08_02295 [Acidobacteria bacterium]|nr:hypothetical protein [Acidobacteriota bacterium]